MKPEPLNVTCAREIAGLSGFSREDLVERWVEDGTSRYRIIAKREAA